MLHVTFRQLRVFEAVARHLSYSRAAEEFDLTQPALLKLGQLVHYLDVGGVQPAEAAGVESVLAGLRDGIEDDNKLLNCACNVFDGLLAAFTKQGNTP